MIKYFFSVLFCILGSAAIQAQDLFGKVYDAYTGQPLSGVKITHLDRLNIQYSDSAGNFSFTKIEVPAEFQFSKSGYISVTQKFENFTGQLQILLQPKIGQLSEVILRSSNIPTEIRKTPAAVGLITATDLRRNSNVDLVQNFNFVPGVYVNRGALNTNKINIRGIGSRSQFSTNRVKAYLDGIPLTTAEGELTLDDIDTENIERIEIFKGPVSSAFGAGLGGSINIYSKTPEKEEVFGKGELTYASFNTTKSSVGAGIAKNNLSFFLNLNKLKSDGYRQNGDYLRYSAFAKMAYITPKGNSWSFIFSAIDLKAFIPSSLNEDDFLNNPEKAAFTWFQSAGFESYKKYIGGISYAHKFSENFKNETAIFVNIRDGYEPRPFNILDEDRTSVGLRTRFNWNMTVFGKPSELSFGAETLYEWYSIATFENLYENFEARKSVQGERLSANDQDRNYVNVFAQLNTNLAKKLVLEAGLNLNTTSYQLQDNFITDEIDQSGDYRFTTILSPRLGLSYEVSSGKNIYTSVSHGFSTPTVAETLTPEGLINTSLKPETGLNYEIGFKGNWLDNRLYTELSLYSIQIRNLLVARRVGQDQFVGVNAGKSNHNGIEFAMKYRSVLGEKIVISPYINSNFNFFEFDKFVDLGENYSGNEIPGVPEYMLNLGLDFSFLNGFYSNINYQSFGETALNDANSKYANSYQLLNFTMGYTMQINANFELGLNFGINNILDEHYASSVLTNAVGFGGRAPRYFYPGNPRNYFGGIKAKYSL